MNQKARQTAKSKVEKDFHKLLNNSNFGNNCRNNIDQCKLKFLFDGVDKIGYLKKFTNIMRDWRYRDFFSLDLMRKQVWREFESNKSKLEDDDDYIYNCQDLEVKREEELEAIELFAKNRKRPLRFYGTKLDSIENKIEQCQDLRKNKITIEFNDHEATSVKSIAVKIDPKIKCTTRFMSGKLLMFAKLSLKSFIYLLVELLSFPDQNLSVAEIYKKYQNGAYYLLSYFD